MKELIEKGYLYNNHGNNWIFAEMPNLEVVKNHNENIKEDFVVGKTHNAKVVKNHNPLQEKTTNCCGKKPQEILHNNTINNTIDNTEAFAYKKEKGTLADPIPVTANELYTYGITLNDLVLCVNGLYKWQDKYFKPIKEGFEF